MATIFDLVKAQEIAAYWAGISEEEIYPCEELFPNAKKRGLGLSWIKGSRGLPVALKTSAFDAAAVPRARRGFQRLAAEMPYFKESLYIDEELRQELNLVLETNNQNYIDSVINRIFDDSAELIRAAAVSREAMRMEALTTGVIAIANNGQNFVFDYGVSHKGNASVSWASASTADPVADIRNAINAIKDDTGATPTRAMCDGTVWSQIRNAAAVKSAVYPMYPGVGELSDNVLRDYLRTVLGVDVFVNDRRYKDVDGTSTKYMPANTFVIFPEGKLGNTWMGTTPAESDLMASNIANVALVNLGVAVTTVQKADPVQVETIVSQICLPSFEAADTVYILDTVQV